MHAAGRAFPVVIAILAIAAPLQAATAPGPDTLGFRFEIGANSDFTNELYYEDTFTDTTFLGRRLVDTPEHRAAAVIATAIQGTLRSRRASYQVRNDLSLGDKVQREALGLTWRDDFAPDWRLVLSPSAEWRHDRTFDRDQEEWRGSLRGRLRRSFGDGATAAELGLLGDAVRTSGPGSEFLLDRNSVRASAAVDHLDLLGPEWRLGYSLATRVFPDSSERDHLEHGWEGRWRLPFIGGHAIAVETRGRRRQTHRVVTTSRDNYWEEAASLEGDWRASERWRLDLRLEGEALQYDVEDSILFFDYQVARAYLRVRLEGGGRWTLAFGPRAERLASRLNPAERYREIAGVAEFELLGARSLWAVSPTVGWRDYDRADGSGFVTGLHSSYAFYALDAFVDQPLSARLAVRALMGLRYEAHTDASQDAGSVYISLQLRWLVR